MTAVRAFQICNGLGAGNIGDELMARAFWDQVPEKVVLDVAVFPEYKLQREPYPTRHNYVLVDWDGNENAYADWMPGLLVGDTPVTEAEGLHWPLRILAPRLNHFHRHGLPVDAVGVGVDRLESDEARELFQESFIPVRSWTVRSAACREALLELGVSPERVVVGADWGWLYCCRRDLKKWGAQFWQGLGVDVSRPLLVANVVNMVWRMRMGTREAIASALDVLSGEHGFQVAFFCNEFREGEFFDSAAAQATRALMRQPSVMAPNEYYSPDETIGLLRHCTVTVSERYHFTIESILAGAAPVQVTRGQKMRGLAEELQLAPAGTVETVSRDGLVEGVLNAVRNKEGLRRNLEMIANRLAKRAECNLTFVREYGWR